MHTCPHSKGQGASTQSSAGWCVGTCVRGCTVGSVLWLCWACVLQGVWEGFDRWSTRCFMGRHVADVGRSRAGDGIRYTVCSGNHVVRGVCSGGCCGGPGGIAVGVCHLECHSPPGSTGMNILTTAVINLQNILKGVQAECTLCSGKIWQNRTSES